MSDVKWIKIVTDIFDDEKIQLIEAMPEADSIIVVWFKILCLAGKQNNGGVLMLNDKIPFTDEMLSTIFRRSVQVVRMALKIFSDLGMVEIISGVVTIPNWEKHQSLGALETAREKTRIRVAAHRTKQKLLADGCNVTETLCNASDKSRLDKTREDKISDSADKPRKSVRKFIPPTLEEVAAYITENGYDVDARKFHKYYSDAEPPWHDQKGAPVKNWKQKIITWSGRSKSDKPAQPKPRVFKIGTADYE